MNEHNEQHTFRTPLLPLAAFILSTHGLPLLRCALANNDGRKVEFVFDDPHGQGEVLHMRFEAGGEAPAADYFEWIKRLRRLMSRVLDS